MSNIWPNFFIVGAAKCGSTSLYEYLRQHPQVFMSTIKEPHFFSRTLPGIIHPRIGDTTRYTRLFQDAADATAIGEASVDYLWDEAAPYRIKETIPHAKIIILLRDPIERAYSHYLQFVRDRIEKCSSFSEALSSGTYGHYYISMGLYFSQVKRYFEVFGEHQIRVLLFEDLKHQPIALLENIADFLGIAKEPCLSITCQETHHPYTIPKNHWIAGLYEHTLGRQFAVIVLGNPRFIPIYQRWIRPWLFTTAPKPSIEKRAIRFLQKIYTPDLANLEQLLGKPLPELRKV